jgi:phenylacetate-CoA ligase
VENAFMHAGWARAGFRLGDSATILRGAFVGTESEFWAKAPFERHLLLSTYFLNEQTYPRYRSVIEANPRRHLQAYPSAATLLADLVLASGDVGRFEWNLILLGSENVYPWQLDRIVRAFPTARVFAWYGHAEQAVLAPMCEHSRSYHAWPFYGLTEVLGVDDHPVKPGQAGELVGTSFWNLATPFIRYRTADVALLGGEHCDRCGRHCKILESIEGRLQEIIVTRSGRYISMTMINMHDDTFDALKQFQFYQDRPGQVVLRAVPRNGLSSADRSRILSRLAPKLGEDMDLSLEVVDEISRTAGGKLRFLDQRLDLKYGDK